MDTDTDMIANVNVLICSNLSCSFNGTIFISHFGGHNGLRVGLGLRNLVVGARGQASAHVSIYVHER